MLESSKVEAGVDDEWFDSIPFTEAFNLLAFVLYPEVERETRTYESTSLRIKEGLEILLPPFTLGDAKAYAAHLSGDRTINNVVLERFTVILDRATLLDGSALPEGALSGLTRRQVGKLVEFYINRTVESEEGNEPQPEASGENEQDTGEKPSTRSPRRSRSTTSKKAKPDTSESSG